MRNHMRLTSTLVFAVLLFGTFPGTALAVDGQIAINQAKAMAGGITPGDAAGFPVTISQPGSYVLSSNLIVPDQNTTGIVIAASHVTIDLNGFAILGPTDCSGGLFPCAGAGPGHGIATSAPQFNITIRNGTIQGMGSYGIQLEGDSHLVEKVHVRSNGGSGIAIRSSEDLGSSIVQDSTTERNGGNGIRVDIGVVRNSTADVNLVGISISVGTVSNSVATRNFDFGLALSSSAGAFGNTMRDNQLRNLALFGGLNHGQNTCSGSGGDC